MAKKRSRMWGMFSHPPVLYLLLPFHKDTPDSATAGPCVVGLLLVAALEQWESWTSLPTFQLSSVAGDAQRSWKAYDPEAVLNLTSRSPRLVWLLKMLLFKPLGLFHLPRNLPSMVHHFAQELFMSAASFKTSDWCWPQGTASIHFRCSSSSRSID